ncbi:ahpC/TSA family protein [Spiroplasma sabaudiense Ar-1343]|uniref:Bacterioferritin comigratory protein n=1 Tax=Spiroplasma sabaudiense Ar-1343 TaxID=1276257 RepID=W6A9F2_9MOLU|nr:peroxiredoxin [Spiroplasma sabaudiense]AHI53611.1 ahpC/TSA family protein [Spiroplasma sabaudiense Ar-1343]
MNWKEKEYLLQNNNLKGFEDMKGPNGIVLFFYPKANTSGCILEVKAFQDKLEKIKKRGFTVVGVSRDNHKDQVEFATDCNITYDLICDTDLTLHRAFGVMTDESEPKVERSTFILDNGLNSKYEMRRVDPVGHIETIIKNL